MTTGFLPSWPLAANHFALFGLLVLAGLLGGRFAAATRVLPAITGYILVGFLLGPGVLNLLDDVTMASARAVADVSLGLIVFDLGRRLDLKWATHDRWLLPVGLAESLLSFLLMFGLLLLFGLGGLEAAVAATVSIATAPAVVLLVVSELKADGPVTRRTLWHVALNNTVALLGVALLLPMIEARATGAAWSPVARSLWIVAGSTVLGGAAYYLMTLLARLLGKGPVPQYVLTVGMVVTTVGLAQVAKVSVLLTLLVLGICVQNLDRQRRWLMDVQFGQAGELFFVVLFVVTGATLRPQQFGSIAWIGLLLVLARSLGKTLAFVSFAAPAKLSRFQAGTLAATLTPIGGLSVGMTQPIFDVAPEFGARLAAIVASGLAILHVLGPIATRFALVRAGEGSPGARPT